MTKLKPDPIKEPDLIDFLDYHSDFSFELKVLKSLTDQGFECEHGGSYTDPNTKKNREFDIRAKKIFGKRFLRFAVECKNIRSNNPLLVSTLPRQESEAFHEIIFSVNPDKYDLEPTSTGIVAPKSQCMNIKLNTDYTLYKKGQPVGKELNQVARKEGKGEIIAGDQDIHTKWSQALSSADDLVLQAFRDGEENTRDLALSLVFPILVVPNERLWITEYSTNGNRIKNPYQVNRCSYFVNLLYQDSFPKDEFTISHLEILTFDGLYEFVEEITGSKENLEQSFPLDEDKLKEQFKKGR